ncbi:hypothetical protein V6N12_071490 [Hibiscus sabdariffa]|uniref:Amino-acid racemase n=1 Tax=Hibiscus sabdariffa TaxID=183260 RepID=A0ABR2FKL4_9ROSI
MSLNCPSYFPAGSVIMQNNLCNQPLLAMPPSSLILQTDESGNFPESRKNSTSLSSSGGSLLTDPNTVGIIGGLSADSTLNFLRKLVHLSIENEEKCVPFVVCSDPVLNRELSPLDKNSSLCSRNELSQSNHTRIVENLRSKRAFLEKAGAHCIVVPCHISHSWHDEGYSEQRQLYKQGFYQEKLQGEGFEVVLPDKATMEHTVIPAINALNRNDMEGARSLLRIAPQVLLVTAVNTVILASDEIKRAQAQQAVQEGT